MSGYGERLDSWLSISSYPCQLQSCPRHRHRFPTYAQPIRLSVRPCATPICFDFCSCFCFNFLWRLSLHATCLPNKYVVICPLFLLFLETKASCLHVFAAVAHKNTSTMLERLAAGCNGCRTDVCTVKKNTHCQKLPII